MRFETGVPFTVIFDTSDELQAIGWACSEMRRADPNSEEMKIAWDIAYRATEVRHSPATGYDFPLQGDEATVTLSVLKRWVALGPPQKEGQVTDAARAKSYKTATTIVGQAEQYGQV